MPFRNNDYANKYTSQDWDVMATAYQLAFQQIGGHPRVQRDRLARIIMTFFDRGVHCTSTLSSLAMSRELSLVDAAENRASRGDSDNIRASDDGLYFNGATGEWKDSTTN